MDKKINVKPKRRFSGLLNLNNPTIGRSPLLGPAISRDYVINTIHDATARAKDTYTDEFYGNARDRCLQRQWWLVEIALQYENVEPGVETTYYLFKAYGPRSMNKKEVQGFTEAILVELYKRMGRGHGLVRYQIVPPEILMKWKEEERIIPLPSHEELNMEEWTINFVGEDLHHNPPSEEEFNAFMARRTSA